MKKKIEVFIKGCDKCGRHDMELPTCMGCGISLCSFCSSNMADKYSMGTRNKLHIGHNGYRNFSNCFKYKHEKEEYKYISFCADCLNSPTKHHIGTILNLCIKNDELIKDHIENNIKYEKKRESFLDKIYDQVYKHKDGKYNDIWWDVKSHRCVQGEEILD